MYVRDLINSTYTKQEGLKPNFLTTPRGDMVSRVNLMGVVVENDSKREMVVDDGSGKIIIRTFDETSPWFPQLSIGDPVLVIGKPREWNNEKYLLPEIIRKVTHTGWLSFRKRELSSLAQPSKPLSLIELIKKLDKGDGVDVQAVIDRSGISDAEDRIHFLLEQGEVFEVKPGRIKLL